MLTQLIIQDVVLIERLSLSFDEGLNVLTGETGAGKSILLDALALALGARSDAGLIRAGADKASVTAAFSGPLPSDLIALLEEQGLAADENPLTLRRLVGRDGKSRAFLCDQPIGIALLRRIGELLIEVHGQFEAHGLLNPASHRAILDLYANAQEERAALASAHGVWRAAQGALENAVKRREEAKNEEAFLQAAVEELDALAPQEGETEKLAARRAQLQHREKIAQALALAGGALEGERGGLSQMGAAAKALSRALDKAPALGEALAAIDRAVAEAREAADQIARIGLALEGDSATLESIEERLFKLRAVARKHGRSEDDLPSLRDSLRDKLALLADQEGRTQALARAVSLGRAAYLEKARALNEKRAHAAGKLARAIGSELRPLKLENASFAAVLAPLEDEKDWGPEGLERVAFQATTNAGQSMAPLHKVASGGELARFMLAIKVVLAKADPVPTLIFDEIDAGIGGATASAVGRRLAQLGREAQVLVVTHSPQIAALAQSHWRVSKTTKGKTTSTNIAALAPDERVEEIARMLAGAAVTPAARKAALALMDDGGKG